MGGVSARGADGLARELLDRAGVKGGLVVHLGCGDGRLTADLCADERYTVHGLEPDPAKVAAARAYLLGRGIYGRVAVERFTGSVLPYTDNLVNLVVVEKAGEVPAGELMRVLAPGGAACILRGGKWEKLTKQWPANIDQWTHFLHDATNNAVAADAVVGPPRSLQWVAPPLWLRSHETPSGIQAPVSADGRMFYIFDEGLIGITDERLPDRWSLICRDAFNGKLLWKRPLEAWGWRQWSPERWAGKDWTKLRAGRTDVPNENQRRIVAANQRVYTTLAYDAPVSVLDAATGKTITTIEQTRGAREILLSSGILVVYTTSPAGQKGDSSAALVAARAENGQVLWNRPVAGIRPLALAIDNGRIIYISGRDMTARDLATGRVLWRVTPRFVAPRTMVAVENVVVMQGGKIVTAHDAANGKLLWQKNVPPIGGGEGYDLFVINGLVWRGMLSVTEDGKPIGKSPHALVIGWDLRTGAERKRILVKNLRSPEHHHRCYRNKATSRYLIGSYEGAEFLDLLDDGHSQNNWLRGACRYGMVPCNGMLYVPPDQCFCQPGAKLLGFTAVKAAAATKLAPLADGRRLEKGPAYGAVTATDGPGEDAWPTYRHDTARTGATDCCVGPRVRIEWKRPFKTRLTQAVAAAGKVFVAAADAHTLYAMDIASGRELWRFTAGGRIDSPPSFYRNMLIFGSREGWVYCIRAADGRLVWRFLAAPRDVRIGAGDQVESVWPVHGSVLLHDGLAYCTAGRSTYLDGGIRLYALEPATGKLVHKGLLKGPYPFEQGRRDVAFFILGANSDVLVSQGGYIYMRQKKLTPELKEINVKVLSSKGAQDVGLHVFSTSSLLDDSWYNRTFWMYSKRWPGYQLANQAPKTGQILVVGDEKTYAVRVFYRRNVHSPMFFPGREGYLLFADMNTNEPQIVGEPGWRKPVEWLPQSNIPRQGNPQLDDVNRGFGADKGIGYTRAEPPVWKRWLDVRIRAMVKAGPVLFVAGPPDVLDPADPYAAFEGRKGAMLVALDARDGGELSRMPLESPPVFDGMIAAEGRLFVSLENGSIVSLVPQGR